MHEYGKNSEGLSGNLISTYYSSVTNNPITPGDLNVGGEVLHRVLDVSLSSSYTGILHSCMKSAAASPTPLLAHLCDC